MRKAKDLTNVKFGKLTVLSRAENFNTGRNRVRWNCICECGNTSTVSRSNLMSGSTKSCGCGRKLKKGEASFNSLFNEYKNNAKKRNIEFNIKKEDFKKLTSSNCHYCGVEPSQKHTRSKKHNGQVKYNGIDRVDNNIGYELENCVSCCKKCNFAKRKMGKREFAEWVSKISSNFKVTDTMNFFEKLEFCFGKK